MISFFELEIPTKKKNHADGIRKHDGIGISLCRTKNPVERYDKEIRRTCNAFVSETIKLYWAIDNSSN